MNTTNKHTQCVLDAGMEVGLDTNIGITKYIPMRMEACSLWEQDT